MDIVCKSNAFLRNKQIIQEKIIKYLHKPKKSRTFAAAKEKHRGVEQLVARQAHNLEVACSSPASATTAAIYGLLFLWSQNIVHAPGRSSLT